MSQTHTIVVRFPEGIVPRYSAATEFQGGQVVAVDFDGNRLHVCQQLEEALRKIEWIAESGNATGHNMMVIADRARTAREIAQALSQGEKTP